MAKPDKTKPETSICDRAFMRYHTDPVFHAKVKAALGVIELGWPDGAGQHRSRSETSQMTMAAAVVLFMQEEDAFDAYVA